MKEPQVGKPRRPHHKSRMGCLQCKQRKVKCDEQKPICLRCEGYKNDCSFLQTYPLKRAAPEVQSTLSPPPQAPVPVPEPSLVPAAGTPGSSHTPSTTSSVFLSPHPQEIFSVLDMELLYSWLNGGAAVFLDFREPEVKVHSTAYIEQAFKYPFLMHQILSISALYLAHIHPEKASLYLHASDSHAATGIAQFQPQAVNINEESCHACLAFSTNLFLQAWAMQDVTKPSTIFFRSREPSDTIDIQWVKLHRGAIELITEFWPVLKAGPMHALFDNWVGFDQGNDPVEDGVRPHLDGLAEAWASGSTTTAEKEVLFKTTGFLRRAFSMMAFVPQIGDLGIVMGWFSWIPNEFVEMLERKVPEALLIAAHYCVALKRMDHVFWLTGKADNLLKTIIDVIGNDWKRWMKWPIEQVLGGDAIHEWSVLDTQFR